MKSYQYASAAILCLVPITSGFMMNNAVRTPTMVAMGKVDDQQSLSTRARYKMDINALDELLDANEEHKLEAIRALIKDIQQTRKNNPEVALPHRVREALAEYHRAEAKYGHDSREAQVAHEYFLDVSTAENMKPEHYLDHDSHEDEVMDAALNAVNALEELKEIAHVEKKVLDRFGSTDFEIGEGFLERGIGRDDEDTYALWP